MNSEKAKDFFSAYYEGTLEPGLVLTLEQKFKSDPRLKSDYDAFATTFANLNTLRGEEIEAPVFLSDRIATRMEEARRQRRKTFSLANWRWMRYAPYALAGLAILGAGLGIAVKQNGFSMAGLFPGWSNHSKQVDGPSFSYDGSKVKLEVLGNHSLVISNAITGSVLRTVNPEDSQTLEPELTNAGTQAQLFGVREDGGSTQLVSVPGQSTDTSTPKGEGTLAQFAVALSTYYHVPVLLENVKSDTKMSWSLDGSSADQSANTNLASVHLTADLRQDGMISINGH